MQTSLSMCAMGEHFGRTGNYAGHAIGLRILVIIACFMLLLYISNYIMLCAISLYFF